MEERDIIIVGGGPSGLSAAIFAQLDGWSTLVLEGNWTGGQGAIAYTVSNYPGFLPGDGALLMENLRQQVTNTPPAGAGAEIRLEKVIALNTKEKTIKTEINEYKAQAIILATGSTMQKLGLSNEETYAGKGVSYYAKRDIDQFTGKKMLLVGGGNSTAKSALLAKTVASEVTLIHRRESLRAYPAMVKRMQKEGINILYNTELKEIKGSERVEAVVLYNNKSGDRSEMPVDWIVICAGTDPDTSLARASGLATVNNVVSVNSNNMTSTPGIFACGEITGCDGHLISAASNGASTGMATSEYLAMEKLKKGETFQGTKNGKYADELMAKLKKG